MAWRFSPVLPKKARASSQRSSEHGHKQAQVEPRLQQLFQECTTARADARASVAVSELPGGFWSLWSLQSQDFLILRPPWRISLANAI